MSINKLCDNCGLEKRRFKCSKCSSVSYCGRECQVAHWGSHKKECKLLRAAKDGASNGSPTYTVPLSEKGGAASLEPLLECGFPRDGKTVCTVCGESLLSVTEGSFELATQVSSPCGRHVAHVDCDEALRTLGWRHGCSFCHQSPSLTTTTEQEEEARFDAAVMAVAPEFAWAKRGSVPGATQECTAQEWVDGAAAGLSVLEGIANKKRVAVTRTAGTAAAAGGGGAEANKARAEAALGLAAMYGAGSHQAKPHVAASWWKKAAEAGHPSALCHYGQLLCDGQGVARRNEAAGVPMMVRAAEAGDSEAMIGLALLYQQGTKQVGVLKRDIPKSELWLRRAADTGTASAHYNLAILLRDFAFELSTVLEARDHATQVAQQLRLAADQGHVSAMANLGARTFQGIGVPKDEAEALRLWRAAAARGNATAKRSLQTVAAMMR